MDEFEWDGSEPVVRTAPPAPTEPLTTERLRFLADAVESGRHVYFSQRRDIAIALRQFAATKEGDSP